MKNLFDIKTYFRFLSKNKLYATIEVIGLSISLMFIIVIAIYASQEMSVDQFQKNKDRIYVLGNEKALAAAYGIGERLMERFPEIEDVISISSEEHWAEGKYLKVDCGAEKTVAKIQYTYEIFFDIFSFPLKFGTEKQVLKDLNSAVISESFARKVFGEQNPIGQVIGITPSVSVHVSGVMKDIDNSVIPYCDILLRIENLSERIPEMDKDNYDNAFNSFVFLLAKPNVRLDLKASEISAYLKDFYWLYEKNIVEELRLIKLNDAYFSHPGDYIFLNHGDWKFVVIIFFYRLFDSDFCYN